MIDWTTIKTEYITGSISTRKLAEKYGIKYSTLRNRAARDGWCAARYTHKSNIVAKVEQKTTEAVSDLRATAFNLVQKESEGRFREREQHDSAFSED